MNRFSQRNKYTKVENVIQLESMNNELRTALWNAFYLCYLTNYQFSRHDDLFEKAWEFYFKQPINKFPRTSGRWEEITQIYFKEAEWYEVYDVIEYFLQNMNDYFNDEFTSIFNTRLENESSAYRIICSCVTSIMDKEEIESITSGIELDSKFRGASSHLESALKLMTDRKNPDFRNSIKESISAIESMCKIVTENPKATLGEALKMIERNHGLHGSLKSAFEKLYGYTSDGDGIRHAMIEVSNLNYSDAKFMLVVCSAFVNYLKSNYSELD